MASEYMHKGMKDQCPSSSDASTKLPIGPSVNEPTRTNPAPTQPTLGPRSA